MKTIKNIIKKSNHPATEMMLAYLNGKTNDDLLLGVIINTIEASNHPNANEMILNLLSR